jgi:archaeosortase A (PGF-CTERM-specific)
VALHAEVEHTVSVEEGDGCMWGGPPWRSCMRKGPSHGVNDCCFPLRFTFPPHRLQSEAVQGSSMAGMPASSMVALTCGMAVLLLSLVRMGPCSKLAMIGWPVVGLGFFLMAEGYLRGGDPVLTVMLSAALPAGLGLAWWEHTVTDEKDKAALQWFRGAVAFAGLPYLATFHVPWLSRLAIVSIAAQTAWMMRFAGAGDVEVGETWVSTMDGPVAWSDWDGNRWFWLDPVGEYPIRTDLVWASDGSSVGVNIVLACTALQSMIVFVGAIAVLRLSWRRRMRALLLTLPLIHVLNVFRNAGIVYLDTVHGSVNVFGLRMFDFAHTYAARFVALFAMYGMALVMFRLLPELHAHVLRLMRPLTQAVKGRG